MRAALVIVLAFGCYRAHPADHVPCDPATNVCPNGQQCVAEAGAHFCEATSFDAAIAGDASAQFTYRATIAECLDPSLPDPAMCKSIKGADQLVIDMRDATTGKPWNAYVRFDLDGAFAGMTIKSVELRLVATDASLAPSDNSGQVWQVQPFTLADLSIAAPAKTGLVLATSQGAVVKLQMIQWPLPSSLVAPGGSVYLGLDTTSTNGVEYWNLAGANPPDLIVDVN